jgi:predicted negative regulator of RcsB-dependent stress response
VIEPGAAHGAAPRSELEAALDRARRDALREFEKRFAWRPGPIPIEWRAVTAREAPPRPAEGEVAVRAPNPPFEAGRTSVVDDRITVEIPVHRYERRPRKVRAPVAHEAAHALLASRLGRQRYSRLSRWWREGVALCIAREGEARVRARFVRALLEGRPRERALSWPLPLDAGEADFDAEGYLVVSELIRRYGDSGLARIVDDLAAGRSLGAALEALAGKDAVSLLRELSSEVGERAYSAAPQTAADALRDALRSLEAGDSEAAARILLPEEIGSADHAYAETTRYILARAQFECGRRDAALTLLAQFWEEPEEGLWEAEALALGAEIFLLQGSLQGSRTLAEECIERFPDDRESVRRAKLTIARGSSTR